jgi:lipopolysaccharide assembly outer membrane protein LptD (OstA)
VPRHRFLSRRPPASMWRMSALPVPRALGACPGLPLRGIGSGLVLAFLLVVLGGGPVGAQPAALAPPAGAVTIPAGEEQATVVADQMQQVGGATHLMIAVGNVEITRGQTRLLADRLEINRDTGQAVALAKVVFYDGPGAWSATASTTT